MDYGRDTQNYTLMKILFTRLVLAIIEKIGSLLKFQGNVCAFCLTTYKIFHFHPFDTFYIYGRKFRISGNYVQFNMRIEISRVKCVEVVQFCYQLVRSLSQVVR